MKALLSIAFAGAALIAAPASAATLIQYNFAGAPGNQASTAASNVAANLTGLAFTRGSGLTAAAAGSSISSSGWSSTDANDFYSFGFTVSGGVSAVVNQLVFGTRASSTGPANINVLAAVDGGAFMIVSSFTTTPGDTAFPETLALTGITALSRVDFRFVAANNIAAGGGTIQPAGTFRVTNTNPTDAATAFSINGTINPAVAPVPEPATWGMMIVGFGMAGGALRRRRSTVRVAFAA